MFCCCFYLFFCLSVFCKFSNFFWKHSLDMSVFFLTTVSNNISFCWSRGGRGGPEHLAVLFPVLEQFINWSSVNIALAKVVKTLWTSVLSMCSTSFIFSVSPLSLTVGFFDSKAHTLSSNFLSFLLKDLTSSFNLKKIV